ncbi:MAG: hypothetical protein GY791_13490 [Alphaproteobacteria bacterium]|nr:hypothetical protein [Alphaproteobacteria bacterium]
MSPVFHCRARAVLPGLAIAVATWAGAAAAETSCRAPDPVCAARLAVFAVTAFDPLGSAVRIGEDLLVTSRHVVADRETAVITTPDGGILEGKVVPSAYGGDLALLRADGLGPGPTLVPAAPDTDSYVFAVGADVANRKVRVYAPGRIVNLPASGYPLARLHHDAYSQPGNSGGALVDRDGRLVAIVVSGGEGRNEAIPAAAIADLTASTGPQYADHQAALGAAYRACFELLDPRLGRPGDLDDATAAAIADRCRATGNRQFMDLAGQVLGVGRRLQASVAILEHALSLDPHAFNTRLSLLVSLHFAGRYADELVHIDPLIAAASDDAQVLRFAIQAGKWGGDRDLAEAAYRLLETHHAEMAPAARRFLDSDAPPPRLTPQ